MEPFILDQLGLYKVAVRDCAQYKLPNLLDLYLDYQKSALDDDSLLAFQDVVEAQGLHEDYLLDLYLGHKKSALDDDSHLTFEMLWQISCGITWLAHNKLHRSMILLRVHPRNILYLSGTVNAEAAQGIIFFNWKERKEKKPDLGTVQGIKDEGGEASDSDKGKV
ncbi:hypothetical protein AgCh_013451 [Apium graveolens]